MKHDIIIVGGSKGGVGKSMVTISLVDYYIRKEKKFILIETDTSNPDVYKNYNKFLEGRVFSLELDEKDGWLDLQNIAQGEEGRDGDVIINTAARNNLAIENHGHILNNDIDKMDRNLITLWPINRQRDSISLLYDYMERMTKSEIYVLRNLYFGDSKKFTLYNESDLRKTIDRSQTGGTFDFPDLADRVTDFMISNRLSVSECLEQMPFGNRMELERWQGECEKIYKEIFG